MTEKVNIVLDASKIDLFETCPARYNFRYNHNKTLPMENKATALDKGTLIHEGLAVYYKRLSEGVKYSERLEESKMKIGEISSNPELSNSDPDEVTSLISTIEENLDYWRAEDENCLEVLAIEEPFAYVLFEDDSVRIIISGKIDLLVNYNGIGRQPSYKKVPIDHKSFSRDSEVMRKSNQFINYSAAVDSNHLIVNRIGLHSSSGRNPKTAEEKFKRVPLSYDPIYIADWKKNLTDMLLNEYLTAIATERWVEKPTSCNKFNRRCEYYAICDSSGQEAKDFKLQSLYIDAPEWDVTKSMISENEK